ncbi:MAG: DNA repair protein RecO [Spirochaetales bacterium]|nr:DNA repair protein RecO [Spirochaetales bacterium]
MTRNLVTEGLILKNGRIGEIHKAVTLLSPGHGILSAIAHGAYKGKSKLSGVTGVFSRSRLYLYHDPVRDSYKITDVEPISCFDNVRGELEKYYTASLWAEVVLRTYAGGGEFGEVYRLFCEALLLLDNCWPEKNDAVLALFLFRYVDSLGYLPDFNACERCGRDLEENEPWHVCDDGSIRCSGCAAGDSPRITPGARRYLSYASEKPVEEVLKVDLDGVSRVELKRAMISIVQQLIGGPLNTLRGAGGIL